MKDDFWKLFEKTGSIDDYLSYACTSEDWQAFGREEGEYGDKSGDCAGDGFVCRSYRGV